MIDPINRPTKTISSGSIKDVILSNFPSSSSSKTSLQHCNTSSILPLISPIYIVDKK